MLGFTKPIATVATNLVPRRGSWGGANQWASQLARYLHFCGYQVRHDLRHPVDCIVMTHTGLSAGTSFQHGDVAEYRKRHPGVPCIQRINDNDVRKGSDRVDAYLSEANTVADHTVFVSAWLRDYHAARWFDTSRSHSVIEPGADPAVFHPLGNRPPRPGEAFRIVTHHWSPHWLKGFDVYRDIDDAIADGRLKGFELWIIGRWPDELHWKTARTFPPASGHTLAGLLRQCHLYVTASRDEPGAMHPVEGIQCGLPIVLHKETGGSLSQCGAFGVTIESDVVKALESARDQYEVLRARVLAGPPSGDVMCVSYRRLIQSLVAAARGRDLK